MVLPKGNAGVIVGGYLGRRAHEKQRGRRCKTNLPLRPRDHIPWDQAHPLEKVLDGQAWTSIEVGKSSFVRCFLCGFVLYRDERKRKSTKILSNTACVGVAHTFLENLRHSQRWKRTDRGETHETFELFMCAPAKVPSRMMILLNNPNSKLGLTRVARS